MRCSPFRLRALLAVLVLLCSYGASISFAAGTSASASSSAAKKPNDSELRPLGGPVVAAGGPFGQTRVTSNAAAPPSNSDSDQNFNAWPSYGGATDADASESEKAVAAGQPSAVLGPTPYDLSSIKRLQVGLRSVAEAPLRVGNLDILAPLVEEMPLLGASVTSAAPKNVPGFGSGPSEAQNFQINLPNGSPIVLTIGKASAWINDDQGFHEQQLRAAPLVIGKQIYLPIFSLAPLLGAAARLSDDGTLVLTPTIQSVDLFPFKDTVAVTIKTSAPLPPGMAKIGVMKGSAGTSPKVYVDFPGYSMGFDAGNSTIERVVALGVGDVLRARVGMPSKFPDTTRIVLDLKRPLAGMQQDVPDQTLFALVLAQPGNAAATVPDRIFTDPQPPAPPPLTGPLTSLPGPGSSLRGLTIVVDAGHGGHDTGARGAKSDEKNHALDIALRLRKNLQSRGASVLMTRETDNFISLQGRVDFANQRRADLFVSVHINASVNRGSSGTESFYTSAASQSLAREVQKQLVKASGRPNRGIAQRRLYVTRNTWMPSILTETAFISNPKEEALLCDPNYRERVARGIAQGVANYVAIYGRPGLSG